MAALELLNPHLKNIRLPKYAEKIYKEECVYSFDTPESETGIYVCLKTFLGFGRDYVELFHKITGNAVFLHIHRDKKEIPSTQQGDGPEKKITRLAIGVEGGFDPESGKKKFEYEDTYSIIVLPSFASLPYPDEKLPEIVQNCVKAIIEAESASRLAELEAMSGTWDGEARVVTVHAESLMQLDNGKRIPPSGWECEKCDRTTNLWLNLTDGSILCGRKFFDGTGGNDHALQHYAETHFPLAVKLGTITNDGKADVFSYDEDQMVEDPYLVKHLAHWGINIAQMEKTEKSMVELELDLNQRFGEWFSLQESGSQLKPLYGPGHTGMVNLGNSCYLNSVMQVLFFVPDFQQRFVHNARAIFESNTVDPASDFNIQMSKLGSALTSGKYSQSPPEGAKVDDSQPGISPLMFKTLVGRGHPDFSTKRQQDAQEFFLHIVNVLQRHSRHQRDPSKCFQFRVEDRFQCLSSKKVKYTFRTEVSLPLPIPLEAAINKEEFAAYEAAKADAEAKGLKMDNVVRPRIRLFSCLEAFTQPEVVEQFYSTALNDKTTARKTTRLASFPDYLLIHLKKFTLREDWVPIKLDVAVEMPDELDLSSLRGSGLQPGEESLPELAGAAPQVTFNQEVLEQLTDMGFPIEACKKALYFTGNQGLEPATNWVMTHIGDSDFADTFIPPGTQSQGPAPQFVPNEEALTMIMSMGFTRLQAIQALKATQNNVERAADWIFNHQSELDDEEATAGQRPQEEEFTDGPGKYQLVAFISHMGMSTMVGHYVCHIFREGRWVIYNDNKVALSENPPKELGYLYLYRRM